MFPDHNAFLDWLILMEDYFEWYNMFDNRRLRFAKTSLMCQAHIWWHGVEDHLVCMGQHPLIHWDKMKMKMECFLPSDHKENLYDQLVSFEKGRLTVDEYMVRFNEVICCGMDESSK